MARSPRTKNSVLRVTADAFKQAVKAHAIAAERVEYFYKELTEAHGACASAERNLQEAKKLLLEVAGEAN